MRSRTSVSTATRDLLDLRADAPIDELRPETQDALEAAGVDVAKLAGADRRLGGRVELRAVVSALAEGKGTVALATRDSSGAWAETDSGRALRLLRGDLAREGAERVIDAVRPDDASPSRDAAAAFVERAASVDPVAARSSAASIDQKTGLRVRNWLFRMDEPRDAALVEIAHRVARPDLGVTPELLMVIANGEGLIGFGRGSSGPSSTTRPVDGYQYLGTDIIGSAAPQLIAKGYLRPSFREGTDYRAYDTYNDGRQQARVTTAEFTDVERGLEAMVALLADARASFVADYDTAHGTGASAQLPDRAVFFFTALYYNTGAGVGRRILEKLGLRAMDRRYADDLAVSSGNASLNAQHKLNVYDHWVRTGVIRE